MAMNGTLAAAMALICVAPVLSQELKAVSVCEVLERREELRGQFITVRGRDSAQGFLA